MKITFMEKGKSGYMIFEHKNKTLRFYYELGGGNCVAIIFVPASEEWRLQTGLPLEDRRFVLTYIAEQAIKLKSPDCRFFIRDHYIEIFSA